jgi:hypothetical protein
MTEKMSNRCENQSNFCSIYMPGFDIVVIRQFVDLLDKDEISEAPAADAAAPAAPAEGMQE